MQSRPAEPVPLQPIAASASPIAGDGIDIIDVATPERLGVVSHLALPGDFDTRCVLEEPQVAFDLHEVGLTL